MSRTMKEEWTTIAIVMDWLKSHGYDGLYYPGECACEIKDLVPCGEIGGDCIAGYKVECGIEADCCEGDWHIQGKKP